MSLSNPAAFFGRLRAGLMGPKLSPEEVGGVNAILEACRGWPLAFAAYALATAYHETAGAMRPVRERGSAEYFRRMYDCTGARPHVAAQLGNREKGDGARFCGRGYVQLTGRRNYELAEAKIGRPLLADPDLAQDPDVAAAVLREGMSAGWFSGRRLADFLPSQGAASPAQFKAARRIINGADRDVLIAGHAMVFQAALQAGGWS